MTRNSVLSGLRFARWSVRYAARIRVAMVIGLVGVLGVAMPIEARASRIFRDLTARDRSQPILLLTSGAVVPVVSPGHLGAAQGPGMAPAYLAFPLEGGERIPAGTPTIASQTESGATGVGPLNLTPSVQSQLNSDLLSSKGVIVNAPDGSYAVAMLPRYARALSQAVASGSPTSGEETGSSVITSMLGINPQANWMINGISSNKLSQWFKTGTAEISHLTSLGVHDVSKTLGVKVAPASTGADVAAQELIPPLASAMAGSTLSVPAPEPSSWLVLSLILAAGLRIKARG